MDHKKNLLELLDYVYAQILGFINGLTPAERDAAGSLERWSARDVIAHCAAWSARMVANLLAQPTDGPYLMTAPDKIDQANAGIYAEHQMESWTVVQASLDSVYRDLRHQVESLPDESLLDEKYFPWLTNRPLWHAISGNSALHPLIHLATYYAQTGQGEKGIALYQNAMPRLETLSQSAGWRAIISYDMACVYALAGAKASAIAALIIAFQLDDQLKEWSLEDPDLDSLHTDPEFNSLFST